MFVQHTQKPSPRVGGRAGGLPSDLRFTGREAANGVTTAGTRRGDGSLICHDCSCAWGDLHVIKDLLSGHCYYPGPLSLNSEYIMGMIHLMSGIGKLSFYN